MQKNFTQNNDADMRALFQEALQAFFTSIIQDAYMYEGYIQIHNVGTFQYYFGIHHDAEMAQYLYQICNDEMLEISYQMLNTLMETARHDAQGLQNLFSSELFATLVYGAIEAEITSAALNEEELEEDLADQTEDQFWDAVVRVEQELMDLFFDLPPMSDDYEADE